MDLIVDRRDHSAEIGRYENKIVRDPAAEGCWYWVGAIGDDGYGRFWIRRPDEPARMIRANRYAVALDVGRLAADVLTLHECDEPMCVRPGYPHVVPGTQAQNLATMGRRGRGGGTGFRHGAPDRAARAARSRAIRSAICQGWDPEALHDAVLGRTPQDQLLLFHDQDATASTLGRG